MYQALGQRKEEINNMKNYKNYADEISRIMNYLRRSRQDVEREKKTGEDTLAAQKKLMTNVLDSYGIPYVQKEEIGSGDKISTRPVFMEVIEELKEGNFDAIAVKEISRLGRGSYSDMGVIYDLLKDKRLYVITPYRIYDCTNESDLKQIRFELFMSREEFETTRERLTTARYNAALEGKWMGNVPFGYQRNEKTLRLEPLEEEAKVIRLIYDLYLNGYEGKVVREKSIATILKRHGFKTAKNCNDWTTTQLRRFLTNDAYIGVSKFRTTKRNSEGKVEKRPEEEHIIVEEAHEPIISPEDFAKVQDIIKNSPNRPKTKLDAGTYELTGVITCANCNSKAVVNRYKRKRLSGDYFDTYIKCNNNCLCVKYNAAEDAIFKILKNLKDAPKDFLYNLYQQQVKKEEIQEVERIDLHQHMKDELAKRKKNAEERLEFLMLKHFEGTYNDEMFKKFEAKILIELDEIKALEEGTGTQEIAATEETESFNSNLVKNNIIRLLDVYQSNASNEEKNDLLRSMICSLKMKVLKAGTKKHAPEIDVNVKLTHRFWENKI
jgi:DNA invertase Pin-like site-specific DNA recombinase